MCHYASDRSCADFSLKMHQKRLRPGSAWTRLGSLQHFPDLLLGVRGRHRDEGKGKGKDKSGGDRGGKWDRGRAGLEKMDGRDRRREEREEGFNRARRRGSEVAGKTRPHGHFQKSAPMQPHEMHLRRNEMRRLQLAAEMTTSDLTHAATPTDAAAVFVLTTDNFSQLAIFVPKISQLVEI